MPNYLLIGLCEPIDESGKAAFDEWFIDQHIEDTTHCPNARSGRARHTETMKKYGGNVPMAIGGAGWYERLRHYEGPGRQAEVAR